MDAFDADVLIDAAVPGHALGRRVRGLFPAEATKTTGAVAGTGSVLLILELLSKPMRDGADSEIEALAALLGRLDLRPADGCSSIDPPDPVSQLVRATGSPCARAALARSLSPVTSTSSESNAAMAAARCTAS